MTLPTIKAHIRAGKGEALRASEPSVYIGHIGPLLVSATLQCTYTILGCGYHCKKGSLFGCISSRNGFSEQRPNPSIPSAEQQAGAEGGARKLQWSRCGW